MKKTFSQFLIERPRTAGAPDDLRNIDVVSLDAQIRALAEHARQDLSSPLIRLPVAHTKLGIGRSTYLRKVSLLEAPQRVYGGIRISAYREIDLDMMLAAQTLAARHGFMLNARAFVAALGAPNELVTGC